MRLALRRNGIEGGLNWVGECVCVCRERALEVDRVCFVEVFLVVCLYCVLEATLFL